MQLLVIRHGIALGKEEFARTGQDDELRPLSRKGKARFREGAPALAQLVPALALVATSPLVRAYQTAELAQAAFDGVEIEQTATLRPHASPRTFARWLRERRDAEVVAAVGHEPHLGLLVSWLLAGKGSSFVVLEKGGACLLDFRQAPGEGRARLMWALTPALLRSLAGRKRARAGRSK